ncbi:galactokinase [Alicyclobacillus sp. ALC3]|uniref:galactokinase n=1 Tax=Alicyclobacillus sp. ALC3 TaxID=2796143 RepID=UPI002379A9B3|nr:galactokinase [Alicyclobacillus sp. ALC3]WDL95664.1 galactokinase [Alicyclobacillus sp. ALC3]
MSIDTATGHVNFQTFSPGDMRNVRRFFAPGRVNLIGEHTDYNGGSVLPVALELGTWLTVRPRTDGVLRFFSTGFEQQVEVLVDDLSFNPNHGFANYPKGILTTLANMGVGLSGGDFFYHSNLPSGAGLSSSAAIEVVTGYAAVALAGYPLAFDELARAAQRAENEYIGVQCGIMDQFSVTLGKQNTALLLDCDSLHTEYIPLDLGDFMLVIINSNKQRSLTESAYNERRQECERALAVLQKQWTGLNFLAHLSEVQWEASQATLTEPVLRRRVRHIVTEQRRVVDAVATLKVGNLVEFGRLLNASHSSLRDDFEVSGWELDTLVAAAQGAPGCIGARMTGAGFGGCAIALVSRERVRDFRLHVTDQYAAVTGLVPSFYESGAGAGVREVTERMQNL